MNQTSSSVGELAFTYYNTGTPLMKFNNTTGDNFLYSYNPENKLIRVQKANESRELQIDTKFRYDGLGRRIEKEVIQKDGTTTRTHYVYNGDNIIFEYDTTQKQVATYLGTGKIDDNLLMIRDGKDYYFHKDHLGSITDITDSVGNVVERIDYSVFGKILNVVDKDGVKTTPIKNPFYFTGREWDEEIGMYYYRARYYEPALGRFLTADPDNGKAVNPLTNINKYIYGLNSPINRVDPLGLFSFKKALGITLAAVFPWIGLPLANTELGQNTFDLSKRDVNRMNKVAIISVAVAANVASGGSLTPVLLGTAGAGLAVASMSPEGQFLDNLLSGASMAATSGAVFGVAGGTFGGVVPITNARDVVTILMVTQDPNFQHSIESFFGKNDGDPFPGLEF